MFIRRLPVPFFYFFSCRWFQYLQLHSWFSVGCYHDFSKHLVKSDLYYKSDGLPFIEYDENSAVTVSSFSIIGMHGSLQRNGSTYCIHLDWGLDWYSYHHMIFWSTGIGTWSFFFVFLETIFGILFCILSSILHLRPLTLAVSDDVRVGIELRSATEFAYRQSGALIHWLDLIYFMIIAVIPSYFLCTMYNFVHVSDFWRY
jgi:hypothetical protein